MKIVIVAFLLVAVFCNVVTQRVSTTPVVTTSPVLTTTPLVERVAQRVTAPIVDRIATPISARLGSKYITTTPTYETVAAPIHASEYVHPYGNYYYGAYPAEYALGGYTYSYGSYPYHTAATVVSP